jgi:hypothetical protein
MPGGERKSGNRTRSTCSPTDRDPPGGEISQTEMTCQFDQAPSAKAVCPEDLQPRPDGTKLIGHMQIMQSRCLLKVEYLIRDSSLAASFRLSVFRQEITVTSVAGHSEIGNPCHARFVILCWAVLLTWRGSTRRMGLNPRFYPCFVRRCLFAGSLTRRTIFDEEMRGNLICRVLPLGTYRYGSTLTYILVSFQWESGPDQCCECSSFFSLPIFDRGFQQTPSSSITFREI